MDVSPESLGSFARGTLAILDAWPAFKIARDHINSPATFAEIRIRLAEELVDAFCSSTLLPPIDELSDFLLRFFEGELDLTLEDQSDRAIARDVTLLWNTPHGPAREGIIERLGQHARAPSAQYQRQLDETETDDEDGDEDEEDSEEGAARADEDAMDLEEADRPSRAEPVVDDEGFTLVQRKPRRTG